MTTFGDWTPDDSFDTAGVDDQAVLRIWRVYRRTHNEDRSLLLLLARLRREGVLR